MFEYTPDAILNVMYRPVLAARPADLHPAGTRLCLARAGIRALLDTPEGSA